MSGDIFGRYNQESTTGFWGAEDRDAAKHPTFVENTPPRKEDYLASNANSVEFEKPLPNEKGIVNKYLN